MDWQIIPMLIFGFFCCAFASAVIALIYACAFAIWKRASR